MSLPRIYDPLDAYLKPNQALIIYGPRQAGKTTLIKNYLKKTPFRYRLDIGDNLHVQNALSTPDIGQLKEYAAGYQLLVIDEAQKIPNIGKSLKIIVDQIPDIYVIVTGSSSFELAGQVGEPLTGRKITLMLYPIAQLELQQIYNYSEIKKQLNKRLIYGSYPKVVIAENDNESREVINEITHSYLLKDILELDKIKNAKILQDLLRMLAYQIGSEVSLTEIGQALGINYKTVARYIDLLEKAFVLYNLRGYSSNLRKEITKKNKYYFYDLGIRNALIANFNDLELRNDVGALWENFLIIERLKKQHYKKIYCNNYFWRTWTHQEVDFVEEREGRLFGHEFKWQLQRLKAPKDWIASYPNAEFTVITKDNFLEFIL